MSIRVHGLPHHPQLLGRNKLTNSSFGRGSSEIRGLVSVVQDIGTEAVMYRNHVGIQGHLAVFLTNQLLSWKLVPLLQLHNFWTRNSPDNAELVQILSKTGSPLGSTK